MLPEIEYLLIFLASAQDRLDADLYQLKAIFKGMLMSNKWLIVQSLCRRAEFRLEGIHERRWLRSMFSDNSGV